jgi:hypothetical protein
VFNLSFYAFHIWTIVAIPGNLATATSTRGAVLHSYLHKQYPSSPKRPHHPQGIQRDRLVGFHHRLPTAAVTAVAANVHQFARIRPTRQVYADLKEAAMVNLSAPTPDERQRFAIEIHPAAQPGR